MMNILLVSDTNLDRAGVCLFLLQWVRGIKDAYNECSIYIYFRKSIINQALASEFNALDVRVLSSNLPEKGTSLSFSNRRKVRTDIRTILNETQFDVVHVNSSAIGFSCIVLSEAYKCSVPIRISHSHGRNDVGLLKKSYLLILKRLLKKYATRYAACSFDAGLYMFGKTGVESNKWCFVPNTIDVNKFSFRENDRCMRRQEIGITNDEILIGATGQLIRLKNHSFLLDVVNDLKKRDVRAKLVIFGEGDQRPVLEEKINLLDMKDDVLLMGLRDDISQWLSALDIYAMPSYSEGLPLGAIEAQANGLCCILSDGVPRDVDLASDVYHCSLDCGAQKWAELIVSIQLKSTEKREQGVVIVSEAGFDSKKTPEYVKKLYGI